MPLSNSVLNRITLHECEKLSEAEILFRNCPQDNLAGHVETINEKIKAKTAKLHEVKKGGESVGFLASEIHNGEFYVLALSLNQICGAFENIVDPLLTVLAKQNGCRCITFSTVRPGLIRQALQNSFIVSEVVMRKHL